MWVAQPLDIAPIIECSDSLTIPAELCLGLATPAELDEIKALDDVAFGAHQGVSVAELDFVLSRGFIITLRERHTHSLIGQSQLLLPPEPEHIHCPSAYAYCYGTAISPAYHRRRLGAVLARAQELLARQAQRQGLFLSARLENAASLKLRFQQGFVISGCAANFYGEGVSGARVLLTKAFEQSLVGSFEHVRVPVRFGELPDPCAFDRIVRIVNAGKVGIGVDANGVLFGVPRFENSSVTAVG